MPCIQVKTSVRIDSVQEVQIKTRLGEAISILPGKSEQWLMITLEDRETIYFQGDKEAPAAFVIVKLFGSAPDSAYDKLTVRITEILNQELKLLPSRIYVQYQEVSHWGWNGANF